MEVEENREEKVGDTRLIKEGGIMEDGVRSHQDHVRLFNRAPNRGISY